MSLFQIEDRKDQPLLLQLFRVARESSGIPSEEDLTMRDVSAVLDFSVDKHTPPIL